MKKKNNWLPVLGLSFVLAGCAPEKNPEVTKKVEEPLKVTIGMSTEHPDPSEEVILSANVKQGAKQVENASEVMFEIRQAGKENSKKIKASEKEKGEYEADFAFQDAGVYEVIAHVTANDMHTMPKTEVTVGSPETPAPSEETKKEQSHADSEEKEHAHHSAVTIDFQQNSSYPINQKIGLVAKLSAQEKALAEAKVRFEISSDHQEKHEFVEAKEETPGEYIGAFNFPKEGTYDITIHVEKGDIHEHQTVTVETGK